MTSMNLIGIRIYYAAREPWLDSRTRATFSEIVGQLLRKCFDFADLIDRENPPDDNPPDASALASRHAEAEAYAAELNEWISQSNFEGYGGLEQQWDREVERVVGNLPWWRRMFGASLARDERRPSGFTEEQATNFFFEIAKHLTTLNIAAILVYLAAGKQVSLPRWVVLMFVASLAGASASMLATGLRGTSTKRLTLGNVGMAVAVSFFFVGLLYSVLNALLR